jgi:predicted nucleic acid-binding protein
VATFGVVIDACALYPARLRDTLLLAAERGLYRLQWTDQILEELRRNLVTDARLLPSQAQHLIEVMRESFEHAQVRGYEPLIPVMPPDPKDRHVAAAAVTSHCQVIVTLDLTHFPTEQLQPFGLEPQSPDMFLTHLYHLYPDHLRAIIKHQVTHLKRPPLTSTQVLERLARFAPEFVALLS